MIEFWFGIVGLSLRIPLIQQVVFAPIEMSFPNWKKYDRWVDSFCRKSTSCTALSDASLRPPAAAAAAAAHKQSVTRENRVEEKVCFSRDILVTL